jgi:hypothetical protein
VFLRNQGGRKSFLQGSETPGLITKYLLRVLGEDCSRRPVFLRIVFPETRLREYGSETLNHPLQDNDDLVLSASNNKPRPQSIASIRYETYGEVYGGCGGQ